MNKQTKVFLGVVAVVLTLVVGIPLVSAVVSSTTSVQAGPPAIDSGTPCGSTAGTLTAPGLRVATDLHPSVGTKACIDSVFTNRGTTTIDLGGYGQATDVTDSHGNVVYQYICYVSMPNAQLAPGKTWECNSYWTAGSAGPYQLQVKVTDFDGYSTTTEVTSINATIAPT
jgi:hypothetical protein